MSENAGGNGFNSRNFSGVKANVPSFCQVTDDVKRIIEDGLADVATLNGKSFGKSSKGETSLYYNVRFEFRPDASAAQRADILVSFPTMHIPHVFTCSEGVMPFGRHDAALDIVSDHFCEKGLDISCLRIFLSIENQLPEGVHILAGRLVSCDGQKFQIPLSIWTNDGAFSHICEFSGWMAMATRADIEDLIAHAGRSEVLHKAIVEMMDEDDTMSDIIDHLMDNENVTYAMHINPDDVFHWAAHNKSDLYKAHIGILN